MSNRPPGGYILIGVDDNGKLVAPQGTFDQKARELFDGARLNDLIRRYTEGPVHVTSQFHNVDGHEVILIYAHHNESDLPVPMSALGQYEKNGKTVQLFRTGDICVRDGAQNVPLRWSHWNELLREHDQRIRDDARTNIESLVAEVAKSLRSPGGRSNVPLSIEMSDDTFVEALLTNIELSGDMRIRYFISQLSGFAADEERYVEALNKATIIAVQALFLGKIDIADLTITRLFDAYKQLDAQDPSKQLAIIVRCCSMRSLVDYIESCTPALSSENRRLHVRLHIVDPPRTSPSVSCRIISCRRPWRPHDSPGTPTYGRASRDAP